MKPNHMASALLMKLCLRRARWVLGAAITLGVCLASPLAHALDLSYSGFGTVGFAISDRPYRYQRFLDDRGTFKRDTVLGAQADLKFSPQWSATYQAMMAPSAGSDDDLSIKTSWAFVSWRPSNDWLLRAGKQRVPLFLNAENRDVGQTHDFARLPAEVYGLAPTTDLIGAYVSRAWYPAIGETTLDVFAGEANMMARAHSRDLGTLFTPVKTDVRGAALTLKLDTSTWRLGLHHTSTSRRDDPRGFPSHYPELVNVLGDSFYGVSTLSGAQYAPRIINDVISLGTDIEVAPSWRVMGEVVRNIQKRTENGANTTGGYVAMLHKVERFTPYVSYAWLRSTSASMKTVRQLDSVALPAGAPFAQEINYGHRVAADIIQAYDQHSIALGASYAVTPSSKLKLEWMRTSIGDRSAMVDSPSGGDPVRHQPIQVLSLNYSFAF